MLIKYRKVILIGLSVSILAVISVAVVAINYQQIQGKVAGMQGQHSAPPDWKPWLNEWNGELLKSLDFARHIHSRGDDLTPQVVESGWLGYPGATEEQIVRLEDHLAKKLPPSYRAFLKASNGFRQPGGLVTRLLPVEDVEWFRVRDQETIKIWKSGGDDLSATLAISNFDHNIYLLNPRTVTADGEWQAIYFSPGGAVKNQYSSFGELMQAERQRFLSMRDLDRDQMHPDEDVGMVVAKIPHLIKNIGNYHITVPNQEMYEGMKGHVEGESNRRTISEIKGGVREAPSPASLSQAVERPKKNDSQPLYQLQAVSPRSRETKSDEVDSEAFYRKFLEYSEGHSEAMRSAKLKVLEIQAGSNQPEIVYRELVKLGRELIEKYQEYKRNNPWVDDYHSNLHNRETGFAKGCGAAGARIIFFLNEPAGISWEELKPRATKSVTPTYSSSQDASATVVILVNVQGAVTRAYYKDGDEGLGHAVAQTLKEWQFRPVILHERGVDRSCEVLAKLVAGKIILSSNSSGTGNVNNK